MNRLFLFLFLIGSANISFSQFTDSVHHRFSYSSTGIFNKTKDARSFVLSNVASFEINQKKIAFNTAASWIYGTQQRQLSNNDVSFFANIDLLKNMQKLYYWALLNFDESYSLRVNYRFQSGVGAGYTFISKPYLELAVSDGFLYETSDINTVVGKDIYQTVRNSLRLKYKWILKELIIFEGVQFAQPSLVSFDDYILKSVNKISFKINKWLAVSATADYNKISRTGRENFLMTYGLTLNKYF